MKLSKWARAKYYLEALLKEQSAPQSDKAQAPQGRVVFIAPIYRCYPILIHALQQQTWRDWKLLLIHDGPEYAETEQVVGKINDPRVRLFNTTAHAADWGHTPRRFALEELKDEIDGEYVVMTNADNYYLPEFVSELVGRFDQATVAVFCDMVHRLFQRRFVPTALKLCRIDCGCLMVRRNAIVEIGWPGTAYEADWHFIAKLLRYYDESWIKRVPKVLFVHN